MMDDYTIKEPTVPYYVHEGMLARNERTIKRLIVAVVISIVALFASNAMWLWAWSGYDYDGEEIVKTIKVDSKDGIANYIGNDGDITNGDYNGDDNVPQTETAVEKQK